MRRGGRRIERTACCLGLGGRDTVGRAPDGKVADKLGVYVWVESSHPGRSLPETVSTCVVADPITQLLDALSESLEVVAGVGTGSAAQMEPRGARATALHHTPRGRRR